MLPGNAKCSMTSLADTKHIFRERKIDLFMGPRISQLVKTTRGQQTARALRARRDYKVATLGIKICRYCVDFQRTIKLVYEEAATGILNYSLVDLSILPLLLCRSRVWKVPYNPRPPITGPLQYKAPIPSPPISNPPFQAPYHIGPPTSGLHSHIKPPILGPLTG